MAQQAFVLRISPSGIDRVGEALSNDQIIIGWAEAKGLLDENLSWEQFRSIINDTYYANENNLRRAGAASGHMWRFIREMKTGDFVIVPYGADFYVAEVSGPATHNESKVGDDTAYRRAVKWLNEKKPIPRFLAKSALISRMKTQGTCAYSSDLLVQIKECVVPRSQDKGADIVATFSVAGAFRQILAIQAKHWQPEPPVGKDVVEQLIRGIEAESADLGMIVTSGTISNETKYGGDS